MRTKIRRKLSSLAFFMQRTYQKTAKAKPSPFLITLAAIALSIFLLGGGVYDILEKPMSLVGLGESRWIYYIPYRLNEQSLTESLIVMFLYAIGAIGFLLMYQSTKYVYKPRPAFILLLIGAVLIVLAYVGCEYQIWLKWHGLG